GGAPAFSTAARQPKEVDMCRFLMGAVVVLASLALTGSAEAKGYVGGRSCAPCYPSSYSCYKPCYSSYSCSRLCSYSCCYWDTRYGCYLYYAPSACCYYYYCAPQSCFLPVSSCPYNTYSFAQPGSTSAPVGNVPVVSPNAVGTV